MIKKKDINNYILLIAWSIAGCSLVAVLFIYWRYRRIVQYYNNYIMKYIRELDLLTKEPEHTCIEKDMIEKLFKTKPSETIIPPCPSLY